MDHKNLTIKFSSPKYGCKQLLLSTTLTRISLSTLRREIMLSSYKVSWWQVMNADSINHKILNDQSRPSIHLSMWYSTTQTGPTWGFDSFNTWPWLMFWPLYYMTWCHQRVFRPQESGQLSSVTVRAVILPVDHYNLLLRNRRLSFTSASIAQPPRVYPVTTVVCSLSIKYVPITGIIWGFGLYGQHVCSNHRDIMLIILCFLKKSNTT